MFTITRFRQYEIEKHFNEDLARVGYWPMDGSWEDKSRNGNDGTAGNGAVFSSDAKVGSNAGSFDGADDYVTVGTDADILFTGPHTLESWVKFTGFPTQWTPISIVQQLRYGLWYDSISKMIRAHRDAGSTISYLDVYVSLTTNTWYHVVQVFDGTNLSIYVNGQLLAKGPGLTGANTNSSNSAIIGRGWNTSDASKLQGLMDDVSIYNRALTAEEIRENFNAAGNGSVPAAPQVDPVAAATSDNTISLSGTKEAGTSIWVNGVLVVPADSSTVWYTTYSLLPGSSTIYVSTQNGSGTVSDPTPVTVNVQAGNLQDPDLVGLWHMDGNWLDYSGNGNHTTVAGGAPSFSSDRISGSQAGTFNGGSYIVNSSPVGMNMTTNFTISGWVNPKAAQWGGIIDRGLENTGTWELDYGPNQELTYSHNWNRAQGSEGVSTGYNTVPLNRWTHIAAVYSDKNVKLYLNGALVASKSFNNNPIFSGTEWLEIGVNRPGADEYFNGLIDEISVYKRALTAEEIERSYHDGLGRVAVLHMDSNWNDASPSMSNGTIHGSPAFIVGSRDGSTAGSFNGVDDSITGSAAKLPSGLKPRSVSAWVKIDTASQKRAILSYGTGSGTLNPNDFALFIDESNRAALGSGSDAVSGMSSVGDGKWHFVAGSYEGPSTNIVKIYVDGLLDGMGVIATPANTSSADYVIGSFLDNTGYFNGRLDELIVYNRVITADEVVKYYNADMGCVAYWQMENNWLDAAGNNNTLNSGTAAFATADKKFGSAAGSFNGSNQYTANSAPVNINLTANFSISGWIYPKAAQTGGIIDRGTESAAGWELWYESGQSISYHHNWNRSQGTETISSQSASVPLYAWTHVAAVYTNKKVSLYVNGIEVASKTFANNPVIDGSEWIEIGVNRPGGDEYFNGLIDELEIYNRALSAEEVRNQFNIDNGGNAPASPGIDPVPSTTSASSVLLTGSKQEGTSLWINGAQLVSLNTATTWSATYSVSPGANVITAWSRNSSGNLSEPVTVIINVPPVAVSSSIANNSANAPSNAPISVLFSEALASSSVTASSVFLVLDDGTNQAVAGSVTLSFDRKTITFTQAAELAKGAPYNLTITSDVIDDFGNRLANDYVLRFTTSFGLLEIKNQGTANSPYLLAPGGYFDVVITNSVVKTAGDISTSTISMTNSTLITRGTLRATSVSMTSYSVLTHDYSTTTDVWPLDVTATSMSIDRTSKIDVTGRGYLGGYSGGNSNYNGLTLGNTTVGGSTTSNGGSYGGYGGLSGNNGSVNAVYGDLMNPNELGSGGGAYSSSSSYAGGNGGGLVKITAGTLQVDGSIIADGESRTNSTGWWMSGGSGGGVSIHVATLSGGGTISAKGGASSYSGGAGSGGRIAAYYDTITLAASKFIASGGKNGSGGTASYNGAAGTIYLKSSVFPHGDLIIDNRNTNTNEGSTPIRAIGSGIISAVTSTTLTNSSAAWTAGALKGLQVNPNTAQTVTFTVTDNTATRLYIDTAGGDLTQFAGIGNTYAGVYSFNSMKVIGAAKVRSDDQLVIDSLLTIDGSTFVTSAVTADTIALSNGGVVTHANATATTTYSLNLNTTTMTIDSNSRIDVTGRGYVGGYSDGNSNYNGRTLGNTTVGGSTTSNGGSYGGYGGLSGNNGSVNAVYGDLMNPNELGSGGGAYSSSSSYAGGNGGGLVKITAGTLQVDGSIIADGESRTNSTGWWMSGGSGGGVNIHVATLSGGGTISAKGGASSYSGGAGSGGRIAAYYDTITLAASKFIASGGKNGSGGTPSYNGGAGTIYLKGSDQFHGDLIINNGGTSTTSATPMPGSLFATVMVDGGANIGFTGNLSTEKDIILSNSQLTVSGGLTVPGNLTLSGGTVTASDIVIVNGTLTLRNQSILTHLGASVTSQFSLDIQAANIVIDSTSRIDVTGRGYLGGYSGGNSNYNGLTLGNTTVGGSTTSNGGSYGGYGGLSGNNGSVNAVYGDLMNPNELGSGGGAYSSSSSYAGGNGGGLVKITAGTLQVDGSIIADGESRTNSTGWWMSGGSGGGVSIHVATLSGGGTISAKGGASSYSGGAGSGGRIAAYYDTITLAASKFIASGGKNGSGGTASYNGAAGTIYLKSSVFPHGDLIIDNRNTNTNEGSTPIRAIGSGIISAVTSTTLTNSSAAWTAGALKGLQVNPNTAQTVTFTVTDNTATRLYIDTAGGDLTQFAGIGNTYAGVYSFNSMKVIGAAKVRSDDQLVIDSLLTIDGSTFVTSAVTADTIALSNGGVVTHANATATTTYSLNLNTTTMTIDSNSRIDVTGRGYVGGYSDGNSNYNGRTLGNTTVGGSTTSNGGSYGGYGGLSGNNGSVNAVYGDLMNPNELGSGGGAYSSSSSYAGGNGGGLVKITAGTLQVDGSIIADGESRTNSTGWWMSGGSGGGVNIHVATLSGGGTISAKGGASSYSGGAGSGGRIAAYYDTITLAASKFIASGGKNGSGGTPSYNGGAGTIYLKGSSLSMPDLIINNGGNNGGTGTSRPTPISNGISQSSNVTVSGGAVVTYTNP